MHQPGKVVNPARGQLNRENEYSPGPRRCLRIWSRETGSAVPSRVSLLILHTLAEYGAYLRDSFRVLRRRPFVYLEPPPAMGSVPSLSGHTIAHLLRSLPRARRSRATNLKIVPNECYLGRSPWTKQYSPLFPTPTICMKWTC